VAEDAASLVVQIKADQQRFQKEMSKIARDASRAADRVEKGFTAANSNAARSFGKVGSGAQAGFRQAERAATSYSAKLDQIAKKQAGLASGSGLAALGKGAIAGIGAGLSVGALTALLDANTRITNSLKVAGIEGESLTKVYGQLGQIAKDTGSNFESLASLYGRVTMSAKELGITQDQVMEFTRRMATGLKASGTDAQQASDGIRQLNQALASGLLRGDEFNSVMENLPVVANAIATGLGVSVGELRKMAEQGELTAKVVFDAFMKGSSDFEAQAAKTGETFSASWQKITTSLIQAVGEFDRATGASQRFAQLVRDSVVPAIGEISTALAKGTVEFGKWWDAQQQKGFEAGKAMGTDWIGPALGLPSFLSDQELAMRAVKDTAKKTSTEVEALGERLRKVGQGGMGDAIKTAYGDLGAKIADGTAKADDFNAAIKRLQDSGSPAGQMLVKSITALREQFVEAGGDADELRKRAEALTDAIAKAFAPDKVDAFIQKIGKEAPDAVGNLIKAFVIAGQEAAKLGTGVTDIVTQLKAAGDLDPLGKTGTSLATAFEVAQGQDQVPGGIIAKGDYTAAKAFLKTKAVSAAAGKDAIEKLDDGLAEKVAMLLKQFPDLVVNEAYRTYDEQAALYAKLKPTGARVAKPGTSRHESGKAVDLSVGKLSPQRYAEVKRVAESLGLEAPFSDDRAHFQMAGGRGGEDAGTNRTAKIREEKKAYDELYASNQKRLDQQREENQINSDWTLSTDQKTVAIEKQKIAQELLDAARAQGLVINDKLKSQIDAQATAMANAGLQADKLKDSTGSLAQKQKQTADSMAELNQAFAAGLKSGITGFINDMRNGVSAGEAFANMLNRIADQLLDFALNALFKNAFGGMLGGGGATLGVGMHAGGTVGRDATFVRAVSPNAFVGAKRYRQGGVAGFAPGEVPAILHKGEVVIPKGAVGKGKVGGDTINNNQKISISVDNKGNALVKQGGETRLGRDLQYAVEEVIARNQRAGGLLQGTGPGRR
jgi:tape measure domain-containing protein